MMLDPLEQLKYDMHQHGVFFGRAATDNEHDEFIFADLTQVCEFLRLSERDLSDLLQSGEVPYTLCIAAGAPRLIIAEDDLWCLALYSPHPLARQWRRWLLSQMLPRDEPTADKSRPATSLSRPCGVRDTHNTPVPRWRHTKEKKHAPIDTRNG